VPPFQLHSPSDLAELTRLLQETGGSILAGGTDLLPRVRRGRVRPASLVDAGRLRELRFVRQDGLDLCLGALSTHADLAAAPLVRRHAPALAEACASVGCPQTRNRGTLGGNLANASPAADSLPPLLVLEAAVELHGPGGARSVSLPELLVGPGRTSLRPAELIRAVRLPAPAGGCGQAFQKLGRRSGMAIAVASVAALLAVDDRGTILTARLALGSLAPTARRSPAAEAVLLGARAGEAAFRRAAAAAQADAAPIDDVRASAAHRRQALEVLVRRALELALARAGAGGRP
jgi:CO/xanthine dehydrogenase FAD-binding subunit